MSLLPIPPALLKPLADQALKLAGDRLGKGNPLVGLVLQGVGGLIDQHTAGGKKLPAELAPAKQKISASLASDFAAMDAAFDRAQEAGRYRGPKG